MPNRTAIIDAANNAATSSNSGLTTPWLVRKATEYALNPKIAPMPILNSRPKPVMSATDTPTSPYGGWRAGSRAHAGWAEHRRRFTARSQCQNGDHQSERKYLHFDRSEPDRADSDHFAEQQGDKRRAAEIAHATGDDDDKCEYL